MKQFEFRQGEEHYVEKAPDVPTASAPFSKYWISLAVVLFDSIVLFMASLLIYSLHLGWDKETFSLYVSATTIITLLLVAAFYFSELYSLTSIMEPKRVLEKLVLCSATIFLLFLLFIFSLKISDHFSRVWLLTWFLSSTLIINIARLTWSMSLRKMVGMQKVSRHIVVVGAGEQARRFLDQFDLVNEPWNRIVGIFDDRLTRRDSEIGGHPVLGSTERLLDFAREYRIDDVIIALPWNADDRLRELIYKLMELPLHIHLSADFAALPGSQVNCSILGAVPMLNVVSKPLVGAKYAIKVLEDKILASVLIVIFSPLLLCIALAIKLKSKGPIIFRQPRHGYNNAVFYMWKFRTMHHYKASEPGVIQTLRNDSRVTRLGKHLRRTSLDELPQLFNVLQGTMSLVGPRPHPITLDQQYSPLIQGYFSRHRVKPGITGWAQINGLRGAVRASENMKARVDHDIYYIENWSLLLDLKILCLTAIHGFVHEDAY